MAHRSAAPTVFEPIMFEPLTELTSNRVGRPPNPPSMYIFYLLMYGT